MNIISRLQTYVKSVMAACNLYYVSPRARYRPIFELKKFDPFTLALCSAFKSPVGLSFCQIGANDGKSNDYLYDLVTRYKWRGVLFEPIPTSFTLLQANYQRHGDYELRNEAVGTSNGKVSMFYVAQDAGLPEWTSQIASFSKSHVCSHARFCPEIVDNIKMMSVSMTDINSVLRDDYDVLMIDAEGMDYQLLLHAEIDRLPRFVAFETTHMSESEWLEIRSKFTRANFDVWWFGTDAVAFRQGY
jgi:FkbM family methyltransferase